MGFWRVIFHRGEYIKPTGFWWVIFHRGEYIKPGSKIISKKKFFFMFFPWPGSFRGVLHALILCRFGRKETYMLGNRKEKWTFPCLKCPHLEKWTHAYNIQNFSRFLDAFHGHFVRLESRTNPVVPLRHHDVVAAGRGLVRRVEERQPASVQ